MPQSDLLPAHSSRKILDRLALLGVKVARYSAGVDMKPSIMGMIS